VDLGVGGFFSSSRLFFGFHLAKKRISPHPMPQSRKRKSTKEKQIRDSKDNVFGECFLGTPNATTTRVRREKRLIRASSCFVFLAPRRVRVLLAILVNFFAFGVVLNVIL
jgi:hypothetical protein|tara:strand:- start:2884 stop:3213 length:330 start_codon:yes stop_codon:yes gene_type:complete